MRIYRNTDTYRFVIVPWLFIGKSYITLGMPRFYFNLSKGHEPTKYNEFKELIRFNFELELVLFGVRFEYIKRKRLYEQV